MKEYETLFISHPEQSETQVQGLKDKLHKVIERYNGRLFLAKNMGKRNLAYEIQKQNKGTYTCLDYTAEPGVVSEIERQLRFDETVLRFLTTIKNEAVDVEARAAEIIARGEDRMTEADITVPDNTAPEKDEEEEMS